LDLKDESPGKRTLEIKSLQSLRDAFRIGRERADLTFDQLAMRAGVDRKTVMDLEKTGQVRVTSMMSVAAALGMSMSFSIGQPAPSVPTKSAADEEEIPVDEIDIDFGGIKP
jgi:DNA-binding XRE family transcriptional regulator